MSIRPVKVFAGIACATAVVAAGAFGATAANADPTSQLRTYVAVGSDTIQDLYDAYANGYGSVPAAASISSWRAFGTPTIVPATVANNGVANAIGRPAGSGDGRIALSAAWNPASDAYSQTVNGVKTTYFVTPGSIQIARSSGKPGTIVSAGAANDNLTSTPVARDAVGVAVYGESVTLDPTSFTFTADELAAIFGAPNTTGTGQAPHSSEGVYLASGTYAGGNYTAQTSGVAVGDILRDTTSPTADPELVTAVNGAGAPTTTVQLHPLLPQSSSGTRQFFQGAIGGNNSTPAATWVESTSATQENNGAMLTTAGDIIPFSAAQWIAQQNQPATNTPVTNTITPANEAIYGIGGKFPTTGTAPALAQGNLFGTANGSGQVDAIPTGGFGGFNRDVFSVAPTALLASDSTLNALLKTTLPITEINTVKAYGFMPVSATEIAAGTLHSPWENDATASVSTTTTVSAADAGNGTFTLTATVVASSGTPSGNVVFNVDGVDQAPVALANGVATATFTAKAGTHVYKASYQGKAGSPSGFASSAATYTAVGAVVTSAPGVSIASVGVTGTAKVGSTLSASVVGLTAGTKLAYQWSANGAPIANATAAKLVIPASLKGKTVTVTVDAFAAGSVSAEATSVATKAVAAGTLKLGTPTVAGSAKVGKTLTVKSGTWTTGTKFKFQWLSNGKAIKGATKSTLKLSASLKGKKISVKVTGSLSGYTAASKVSKTTKAVAK